MGISPELEGEEMNVNIEGFAGGDRTNLNIPASQERLLQQLVAFGKPVVLVLMNGSALSIPWEQAHVPAILDAWYPGQQGGNAVADVLFGDYNPAGRVPVTFYRSVDDLPAFDDYAMEGKTYRYFRGSPLYPFGFGLSYTAFQYQEAETEGSVHAVSDTITVEVTLKNVGDRDGDEVIQLYARPVKSVPGDPIRALKAFRRTHLRAGEVRSINLRVPVRELRVYDDARRDYVVRPGQYEFQIGASSSDIRLSAMIHVGN
jgi:beta-glucosidase